MRKTDKPGGIVRRFMIESPVLKTNLLGDSAHRIVDVYLPPGSDGRGLPLLVDLAGYASGGPSHTNWTAFRENVPERLDRLIGEGKLAPVVVAFPDCFTRVGGNQYINSAVVGRWADFLVQEMTPFVEREIGCGGDGRRGVFGKSSGGYGALVHALDHGDFWAAAACQSGDMGFELCYLPDMPATLRSLARENHSIEAWWRKLEEAVKTPDNTFTAMNILAMAAHYDPDPSAFLGMRLPVSFETCELIPERWENWLAQDPLVKLESRHANLRRLKALYIDCGTEDQFNFLYGARRFVKRLADLGIVHRYEEFPDNHFGLDYRLDISLPYLAAALSK